MNGRCSKHGTIIQYRDVGNGKSAQYCPDCDTDHFLFSSAIFSAAQKEADADNRWDKAEGSNFGTQISELTQQLEASKQRELELLAVIERMEPIAYLNELDEPYTMYGWSSACINPDHRALYLKPVINTKALREHEAKVLVTASNILDDLWVKGKLQTKGAGNELRRMAEERRTQ